MYYIIYGVFCVMLKQSCSEATLAALSGFVLMRPRCEARSSMELFRLLFLAANGSSAFRIIFISQWGNCLEKIFALDVFVAVRPGKSFTGSREERIGSLLAAGGPWPDLEDRGVALGFFWASMGKTSLPRRSMVFGCCGMITEWRLRRRRYEGRA